MVRCTLTTTLSPVCSVAAWTWAIEAAASGVAVEPREHVLEPGAEVLLDGEAHLVERLGGHLVAALLELARPARPGTAPRRRR